MATQMNGGGAATLPLDVALAILQSLPRPVLSRLITRMIDCLDEIDGDVDLEGDNEDCGHDEGEPDFRERRRYRRNESGPGCAISESDYGDEEAGEPENGTEHPAYGIDQSTGPLSLYAN